MNKPLISPEGLEEFRLQMERFNEAIREAAEALSRSGSEIHDIMNEAVSRVVLRNMGMRR